MKRWIPIVVALAALSLVAAGCGSDSDGSMPGMDMGESDTSESPSGDAFNDADVMFAQGMIPHHEQAVEMAGLAADRAESQEVKDLAADIEGAQGPEIEQMTAWLEAWDEPVDMGGMGAMEMDGMMSEGEMSELEAADGAAFDKLFLEMMIKHHRSAIAMAEMHVDAGENPDVIALAEDIIDAQQAEIETMEGLLEGA